MIIGFDNSGFYRPAQIIGVETIGFRSIIITQDEGAYRITGFDNVSFRIIAVISQGED